jgi:hypothetical protein
VSCNAKKGATVVTTDTTESEYNFENISENDSLFASIDKGACFGKCPVYSMKIYNSGSVRYYGKNFVEKEGSFSMVLDKDQMSSFVEKAKEINYMEMDDTYDNRNITDLPSIKSSIVIDKTRKSIKRRFGYPKEILEFEKLFEDLLASGKWEKTKTSEKDKY